MNDKSAIPDKKSWLGRLGLKPTIKKQLTLDLEAMLERSISRTESGARAAKIIHWYAAAPTSQRTELCLLLSQAFAPDLERFRKAKEKYEALVVKDAAAGGIASTEQGIAEIALRRALISPRRRLLQGFAAHPEGIRFLVDMRAELLGWLADEPSLRTLDAELDALFTSWFDVAFLQLKRISWDSPASLLEKLIKYEAVHDISSWDDLKNRLDADRRCYGFFHPRLPNEPLIFVEVAFANKFQDSVTTGIAPLLDVAAAPTDLSKVSTAIFYSISNTQAGLRGVSFGDSLIKLVVETLKSEFPQLKTFTTLSPIPGLARWLGEHDAELVTALRGASLKSMPEKDRLRKRLMTGAAQYLARGLTPRVEGTVSRPLDPVARFHLSNGARVERINWAGDLSPKGMSQSFGLMVNYLYDLKSLDKNRTQLANRRIMASKDVTHWL
jgi:malonyl-CoA decarboxylase